MFKQDLDNIKEIVLFVMWVFTVNSVDLVVVNVCACWILLLTFSIESVLIKHCAAVSFLNGIVTLIRLYNNTNPK